MLQTFVYALSKWRFHWTFLIRCFKVVDTTPAIYTQTDSLLKLSVKFKAQFTARENAVEVTLKEGHTKRWKVNTPVVPELFIRFLVIMSAAIVATVTLNWILFVLKVGREVNLGSESWKRILRVNLVRYAWWMMRFILNVWTWSVKNQVSLNDFFM